jgi:hypothetical protein
MHRSGTSSVARALNLLGVYLGEDSKVQHRGTDNPEGFWEHREILDLQVKLLARLNRAWDTTAPLPVGWRESAAVRPFAEQLKRVIATDFGDHPVWGWKDPRTCLLLPLWREVLRGPQTRLVGLFVVRNPVDVANSLIRREPIPFAQALAIWFNYCAAALSDGAGLPLAFLSYDKFLTSWEPELRRCVAALGLEWPKDLERLRADMQSFLQTDLRHNKSENELSPETPAPVRELYGRLVEACSQSTAQHEALHKTASRLYAEYSDGRSTGGFGAFANAESSRRPSWWQRTRTRWKKSLRKRIGSRLEPSR